MDNKTYSPKYFSCATPECLGKNLDNSDPSTQTYIQAMQKKFFDDVGKGATVATIVTPSGPIGATASVVGTLSNVVSGYLYDPVSAAGKEISQRGFGEYLKHGLQLSAPMADRIVAVIDLVGGWDSFVNGLKDYSANNNSGKKEK